MGAGTDETSDKVKAALAATSWALLGMMSYEEEVSGYDLKKWIDWSVDLYYWSPVVQPDLYRAEEAREPRSGDIPRRARRGHP